MRGQIVKQQGSGREQRDGREERGVFGENIRPMSERGCGWFAYISIAAKPNNLACSERGRKAGWQGGRVPGVNSSSPVASSWTVCSRWRRQRRRPKVWSPENSKRETARRRRRRHLSLPSFGLSQACAGGGRPPTSFALRPAPPHSNLRLFAPHHLETHSEVKSH